MLCRSTNDDSHLRCGLCLEIYRPTGDHTCIPHDIDEPKVRLVDMNAKSTVTQSA